MRGQWGVRRNLFSQEAVECVVVWEEWQGEVEIKGGQVTWRGGYLKGVWKFCAMERVSSVNSGRL